MITLRLTERRARHLLSYLVQTHARGDALTTGMEIEESIKKQLNVSIKVNNEIPHPETVVLTCINAGKTRLVNGKDYPCYLLRKDRDYYLSTTRFSEADRAVIEFPRRRSYLINRFKEKVRSLILPLSCPRGNCTYSRTCPGNCV